MNKPFPTPTLSQKVDAKSQPEARLRHWAVFAYALLFVIGFSLVFTISWGAQ